MLAQMQAQRLCPTASFAGSYACFHRTAPAQPIHLSSSRQHSDSQLRQRFCSASIDRRHHTLIVNAQSSNGAVARPWADKNARLVLEDGSVWEGRAFGAEGTAIAETVFNTSLTGYQEILTDPSYKGQYVVFTHPHIGNVGINFGEQAQLLESPCISCRLSFPSWSMSELLIEHFHCLAMRSVPYPSCWLADGYLSLSAQLAPVLNLHPKILYALFCAAGHRYAEIITCCRRHGVREMPP